MDPKHLHDYIIWPIIDKLPNPSLAASRLVLGTALTESEGEYVRQKSDGPALGLWQMEPNTHDDIWTNYLMYHAEIGSTVASLAGRWPKGAAAMVGNLNYGAAMCRIKYLRVRASLPNADDAHALAAYWKKYYNSPLGLGTIERALPHFEEAIRIAQTEVKG